MRVDEAVVISLPEREDRRQQFLAQLPQPWPFPPPRFAPGVREIAPAWYQSSSGAWGCRTAHLNVLRDAWNRGVNTLLVMEDDAIFCDNFPAAWKQIEREFPLHTDMVMLGGEHALEPTPFYDKLVRCNNTRRTHAYIVKLKAIPFLIGTWSTARRHIDHSSVEFQSIANVYAPRRFLVGQRNGWSDISRKENPDTRFWEEPARL